MTAYGGAKPPELSVQYGFHHSHILEVLPSCNATIILKMRTYGCRTGWHYPAAAEFCFLKRKKKENQ